MHREQSCQSLAGDARAIRSHEQTIRLPALKTADSRLAILDETMLQILDVPTLEQAGGIAIDGNTDLPEFELPVLVKVSGTLSIRTNPGLQRFDCPALQEAVGIYIESNDTLAAIGFGALQEPVQYLTIKTNPLLPSCSVTALARVTGSSCSDCGSNGTGICN